MKLKSKWSRFSDFMQLVQSDSNICQTLMKEYRKRSLEEYPKAAKSDKA